MLIALWASLAGLVIFRSVLSTLSDPAVLAVAVMLSVPLTCALFWSRRMRRLAARRAYLRADSRYFVWLRGGFWMLSGQFALALLWTGLLLVGLARQKGLHVAAAGQPRPASGASAPGDRPPMRPLTVQASERR